MKTKLPKYRVEKNQKRSRQAEAALEAFAKATGLTEADRDVWISDLLCNLMHYCDGHNRQFVRELDRASMHYEAEIDPNDDIG